MKKKVLLVDDEASIRLTLSAVLKMKGFDVSVAATVPEAITAIQKERFDILLSDLNIGQPGDGFTVVSAMRRIQPDAATILITGYPDFESALIAIRNQVDTYVTKPTDIEKLVDVLQEASSGLPRERAVPVKRISVIIREARDEIVQRWLTKQALVPELSQVRISEKERIDHIPDLLLQIADCIESRSDLSETIIDAAGKHGAARHKQGFTIPMLLIEAAILEKTVADLLQEHLLSVDLSMLISDMHQLSRSINCGVEISVRMFLGVTSQLHVA
jgi:YesN/AraC family two-component response regulator